jgi:hypothetical protein
VYSAWPSSTTLRIAANRLDDGLIFLLPHAQLAHSGSVEDQPKQLSTMPRETKTSSISRGHT